MYKHPGVYIEHVPSGVLAIEAAATAVAAFIGPVKRGTLVTATEGAPVFLSNASQFAQQFGALNDGTGGIRDEGQSADFFGHAVNAYFANGGSKAYIVPIGDGAGAAATAALVDPNDATKAFYFSAQSPGDWANGLIVRLARSVEDSATPLNSEYTLVLGLENDRGDLEAIESFTGLSMDPASGRFLVAQLEIGSALVTVTHADIAGASGGQVQALLGTSLAGFDPTTVSGGAEQLVVSVDGSPVTVNLPGPYAGLSEIATLIQSTIRADDPADDAKSGFRAEVTRDQRLLLVPGTVAAANPAVVVQGGATAVKLGLDPTVYRGDVVSGFDAAVLDGQTIVLTVDGTDISVTLATPPAADPAPTLAAVATQIQTAARANPGPNIAGFAAEVTADNRLRFFVTGGTPDQAVTIDTDPASSSAAALANLGLTSADTPTLRPTALAYPQPFSDPDGTDSLFAGGTDHGTPTPQHYTDALLRLRDYRDITILLLPGRTWVQDGDNQIIEAAITHAEFMKNRMVIVDPPNPALGTRLSSPTDVRNLGAPTSPYTALYYPWLTVSNPHYDPDTAANKPKTFAVPPSATAAGLWARIDGARGVWKAPAGLEATVRGAIGPNLLIGNALQDNLNEWGINCLRPIIGPTVVWGARTLASKAKPEFRYVPVRRTQNMIGESLYGALQAVVFEPNDHRLWASLRASVTDFMDGLHRSGAFQGKKASDAYYVRCGLGSTMTQADIDLGIVRVVVGFAPLKPAEFVVVQIKQIVGRAA